MGKRNFTFWSTDLLCSTVDIAFFRIVRCETASRLSLEGLVVHLLQAVRQEPSEQGEYCAFFDSVELFGLGTGNDALVLVGHIFLYEFT